MTGQKKLREIRAIPLHYKQDKIMGLPLITTPYKIIHLQRNSIR